METMRILQGLRVAQAAVKNLKLSKKIYFFCIYLLVMPKYWGKQIFTHGRFLEVGQKQKTEKKKKGTHASRLGQKRERERAKVGNNNGLLRIATTTQVAHVNLFRWCPY